jgi:cellulose biosynthesis protein BcsQ
VKNDPYVLAVASHKGGTGRTTAAMSLAWTWGQEGLRVTLVDADPVQASRLVALDPAGRCPWPNVRLQSDVNAPFAGDRVVIDCPSLLDPAARAVLRRADGIVVCCLADPLSLRTVPAAASVIRRARDANPRLELLGILIAIYDNHDEVQAAMLGRLRQAHERLLLEPPVPQQPELRDWPLEPGADLPPGPGREAYAVLARNLEACIRAGVSA